MGASDSQPQQNTNIRKTEIKDQNVESKEEPVNAVFIHEKFEELTYDENNQVEIQKDSLFPLDLFDIATIHPDYCRSVENILRQAIREESIRTSKSQVDYYKNFSFSDKMEKSRLKVLDHFKNRKAIKQFIKDTDNTPIKISYESNMEVNNEPEINFRQLFSIFRDNWYINNIKAIENLNLSIKILNGMPPNTKLNEETIRQNLKKTMGNNYYIYLSQKGN